MADTIPVDDHVIGDSGHVTDHNDIADVLGLLATALTNTSSNTSAILALQNLQSVVWEPYPVSAWYPAGGTTARTATAQVADPYLTVSLQANAVYRVELYLHYNGGAGGSAGYIEWSWTNPTSSNWYYVSHFLNAGTGVGTIAEQTGTGTGQYAYTDGVSTTLGLTQHGTLITAGTAGSLTFNWGCQNNSGTNTHVVAGSLLTATRIG